MANLSEVERQIWISFHEFAYKDDLELAKKIVNQHARWSIIIGYYAMHDIAKLYLGKIHNIKISGRETHKQTIDELKKVIGNKDERERIIKLLEIAEEEIREIQPALIPYLLLTGKKERGKAQYYSPSVMTKNLDYLRRAEHFLNDIVKIFINIMEKLVEDKALQDGEKVKLKCWLT